MAEKPKKEGGEAAAADKDKAAPKPKKGIAALLTKTPVMLGGVMIIEFVILVAGFKIIAGGQPKTANGADLVQSGAADSKEGAKGEASTADKNRSVEIQLVEFKALNKLSGHSFLYDVSIYITVKPDVQQRIEDAIKEHEALIKDRVRTIIAEMDPEKLGGGSEPGLETLRRQVKFQLDEMLGEGLVNEVLVPRCIPFRTDY